MASIATTLTRNLRLFSLCNNRFAVKSIQRNLFAPAAVGIDGFLAQRQAAEAQVMNNRENLKKRITEALTSNTQIFTEDLKTLLYLTKSDEELELLKKSLEKYEEKNVNIGITEYSFGPQIMRLLYVMNKPDLAIEMFFNEKFKKAFNSPTSLLLLLNKLNEDKRFQDTIKVFDRVLQLPNYFFNPKFNSVSIPVDIIRLTVEAYYHDNSPQVLNKLKLLVNKVKENPNQRMPRNALTQAFFTAVKHKDYDYALELASMLEAGGLQYNLKAIVFALLNRFNDGFEQVQKVLGLEYADKAIRGGRDIFVFSATLKYLRDSIEAKKDDAALKKFEEVSKSVYAANRLSRSEVTDIFTRVVMTRMGPNNRTRDAGSDRFGSDGGSGAPGQRFNRFEGGDRPPRPQSDRFQQQGFRPNFRQPREFNEDTPQQGFRPNFRQSREFNEDTPQQGFRSRDNNTGKPQSNRFQQQNRPRRDIGDEEI